MCSIKSIDLIADNTMSKRINIILPNTTVAILDRVATKGTRSRFIDRAVRHYVETRGRESLREQLKAVLTAFREMLDAFVSDRMQLDAAEARQVRPRQRPGTSLPSINAQQ